MGAYISFVRSDTHADPVLQDWAQNIIHYISFDSGSFLECNRQSSRRRYLYLYANKVYYKHI